MSEEMSAAPVGESLGTAPIESSVPTSTESVEGATSGEQSSEGVSASQVIEGSSPELQENIESLAEQVKDAIDDGASKKEVQNLIKEFELKVNGKQIKTKIDLSDDEAIKRELQKAHAFNDVSQENATIKKALQQRIAEWKQDPVKLFEALELDPTEWSANHLDKLIEEQNKSPEQKEAEAKQREYEEMRQRIAEMEAREERLRKAIQEQEEAKQQEILRNSLIEEMNSAISQSKFLENTPEVRQELADLMYRYSEKYPDQEITAEMVLPILEKQYRTKAEYGVKKFQDNDIISTLGKDTIERLYKQLKQQAAPVEAKKVTPVLPSQTQVPSVETKKVEEPKKRPSLEDIMRRR